MLEAVGYGALRVPLATGAIHGLQEEVREVEMLEAIWLRSFLGEHELQFVACSKDEVGTRLGADTQPVQPARRGLGPVGLNGYFEAPLLKSSDEHVVQLQQRLTTRAHDEGATRGSMGPRLGDSSCELGGRAETASTPSIGTYEVGVAPRGAATRPLGSIAVAPAPEIAASKPKEHGCAARLRAFPLERVIELLD